MKWNGIFFPFFLDTPSRLRKKIRLSWKVILILCPSNFPRCDEMCERFFLFLITFCLKKNYLILAKKVQILRRTLNVLCRCRYVMEYILTGRRSFIQCQILAEMSK